MSFTWKYEDGEKVFNFFMHLLQKNSGFSWFHLAIRVGKGNLIDDLTKKFGEEGILKQEVNKPDNHGNTPLHKAAFEGQIGVVKWLCENGADINALNQSKQTSLFYAEAKVDDNKEGA